MKDDALTVIEYLAALLQSSAIIALTRLKCRVIYKQLQNVEKPIELTLVITGVHLHTVHVRLSYVG